MQLRRRWCVLALLLAVGSLGVYAFVTCMRDSAAGARSGETRGKLYQIRLALENYQDAHGHPIPRVSRDEQGQAISWRQGLSSYLDFQGVPVKAPVSFRLPFEQNDPRFTSVIAVYDADKADDGSAPWAVVAIEDTGIPWNEPRDFTFEQFASHLSLAEAANRPVALLTADGEIGAIAKGRMLLSEEGKRELLHLQMFRRPDRGDEVGSGRPKDGD